MIERIQNVVIPATRGLNYVGAFILLIMMLMIVADVIMRNVFNSPIQGSYELIEYMMVTMVFFFFAHAQVKKGHISVTMVVRKLPIRVRGFLQIINYAICTIIYFLISHQMYKEGIVNFNRGDISAALFLPHFPFVFAVAIGGSFLTIVFFLNFLSSIKTTITGVCEDEL